MPHPNFETQAKVAGSVLKLNEENTEYLRNLLVFAYKRGYKEKQREIRQALGLNEQD